MQTVGAYEAKTKLPSLLERVSKGESFTITRHGTPVAMLSKPTEHREHDVRKAIDGLLATRYKFARAFEGLDNEGVKRLIEEGRM